MNFLRKLFELLASIELAVFVILAIALVSAVGTIYEAKYGAEVASLLVYRSWYFTAILFLFMLNLLFVGLSRWPWKRHHIGFLVTHLGLITILIGSIFTRLYGVDGSVALAPGESANSVRVDQNYLNVFLAVPEKNYEQLLSEHMEFNPLKGLTEPREWKLAAKNAGGSTQIVSLKLLQWWPNARREIGATVVAGEGKGVPAVHFRISGSRANINEWLFLNGIQGSTIDLGPAIVRFQKGKPQVSNEAEKRTLFIYLENEKDTLPKLAQVDAKSKTIKFIGKADVNKAVQLGWMDFEFFLEEFFLKASPATKYFPTTKKKDSVEVVQVELNGESRWLEMGSAAQVVLGDALYYVQYAKMQVPLGFELGLNKFHVDFYEGSRQAKSYESRVRVPGLSDDLLISMNEPLEYKGFTFYQSSYSTDEEGNPVVSVLSVNRDPGRGLKYLGSLMLVLGILSMFYFKPIYSGKSKLFKKAPV